MAFWLAGAAAAPAAIGVDSSRGDEPTDLPACRAEWTSEVLSMTGHRRAPVVSFWLRNGVRVHHLKMLAAAQRGAPISLTTLMPSPQTTEKGRGAAAQPEPAPEPDATATSEGGLVVMTISVVGGELRETHGNRGISAGACAPWDELSVQGAAPARAQVALEGRSARLEAVSGQDTLQLRISAKRADLEEAMRVATALLQRPQVTPEGLRSVMAEVSKLVAQRGVEEREIVSGAISEAIFPPDDARLRMPTPEELSAVTVDSAQRWLQEHLKADGAPIEVSIVGDISLEDAMQLVAGYLGQLPPRARVSPERTRELRTLPRPKYPVAKRLIRPIDPEQAIVVVGLPGADAVNTRELRTSRVAARLLDDWATAGLVKAGFDDPDVTAVALPATVYPGFGVIVANFRCERARADEAADAMLAGLAALVREGARAESLPPVLEELARGVEHYERLPWYWSGILARSDTIGVKIDEVAEGGSFYRSLNVDAVNDLIRRNYGDGNSIRVIIEGERFE